MAQLTPPDDGSIERLECEPVMFMFVMQMAIWQQGFGQTAACLGTFDKTWCNYLFTLHLEQDMNSTEMYSMYVYINVYTLHCYFFCTSCTS